jgi:class 3 adenylate cyclase
MEAWRLRQANGAGIRSVSLPNVSPVASAEFSRHRPLGLWSALRVDAHALVSATDLSLPDPELESRLRAHLSVTSLRQSTKQYTALALLLGLQAVAELTYTIATRAGGVSTAHGMRALVLGLVVGFAVLLLRRFQQDVVKRQAAAQRRRAGGQNGNPSPCSLDSDSESGEGERSAVDRALTLASLGIAAHPGAWITVALVLAICAGVSLSASVTFTRLEYLDPSLADGVADRPTVQNDATVQHFQTLFVVLLLPVYLRYSYVRSLVSESIAGVCVIVVVLCALPHPLLSDALFTALLLLIGCGVTTIACFFREIGDRSLFTAQTAAEAAEKDANELLRNLLPAEVVQPIMAGREVVSQIHRGCAILFLDLAGFTKLSSTMEPRSLMTMLNTLYSRFDAFTEERGLYKAETIGDAYIVLAGLFEDIADAKADAQDPSAAAGGSDCSRGGPNGAGAGGSGPGRAYTRFNAAPASGGRRGGSAAAAAAAGENDFMRVARVRSRVDRVLDLALAMQAELDRFRKEVQLEFHMRVGVHVGDVVTGIVGSHRPRFGVFGLPMLIAEHLESLAETDTILCSVAAQRAYLASHYAFLPRILPREELPRFAALGSHDSIIDVSPAAAHRGGTAHGMLAAAAATGAVGAGAEALQMLDASGMFTGLSGIAGAASMSAAGMGATGASLAVCAFKVLPIAAPPAHAAQYGATTAVTDTTAHNTAVHSGAGSSRQAALQKLTHSQSRTDTAGMVTDGTTEAFQDSAHRDSGPQQEYPRGAGYGRPEDAWGGGGAGQAQPQDPWNAYAHQHQQGHPMPSRYTTGAVSSDDGSRAGGMSTPVVAYDSVAEGATAQWVQ